MSQLVAVREARTGAELLSRYSAAHSRLWPRPRLAARVWTPIPPRHVYLTTCDVGPHAPPPPSVADEAAEIQAMLPKQPRVIDILCATADHFGMRKMEILSHRRHRAIVLPRQVVMYLSRELTNRSLPEIGRLLGRDHTSVLHGVRKIASLIEAGDPIAADVATIRGRLCLI